MFKRDLNVLTACYSQKETSSWDFSLGFVNVWKPEAISVIFGKCEAWSG